MRAIFIDLGYSEWRAGRPLNSVGLCPKGCTSGLDGSCQHQQQRPLPPREDPERARGIHPQLANRRGIRHQPELTVGRHVLEHGRMGTVTHRSIRVAPATRPPGTRDRSHTRSSPPTSSRAASRVDRARSATGRDACCRAASPSSSADEPLLQLAGQRRCRAAATPASRPDPSPPTRSPAPSVVRSCRSSPRSRARSSPLRSSCRSRA